jgi:hypothetical protein
MNKETKESRPRSLLQNGKINPEYRKWYRRNKPEVVQRYNASKKHKECVRRMFAKKRENNEVTLQTECMCVKCGIIFKREDALLRGYRFIKSGPNRVICDECA